METASRKVINEIIKRIENKELRSGDRMPSERELASQLKVSRSSVREALSAMNMLGMISSHPKGKSILQSFRITSFINTMSTLLLMEEDIDLQISEFRICIESEAARLAAIRSDGAQLRRITEKMKQCTSQKRADKLDVEYHLKLAESSKNLLLIQASEAVMSLIEHSVLRNRTLLAKRYPDLKELVAEHEQITQAIEAHDGGRAAELIRKHLCIDEKTMDEDALLPAALKTQEESGIGKDE